MMTKIRSDRPLDDSQIARVAPSVFATAPHSSRGETYAFIPTSTVLAGLRTEGFNVYEAMQARTRIAGKREFTKHMLRLRRTGDQPKVGGEFPEIVLTNSHDGSSAYRIAAGWFRLVCSNGMVVGDMVEDYAVRHSGRVVDDVIEGVFSVVEDMAKVEGRVEQYRAITLSQPETEAFAEAASTLRWGDSVPVLPQRLLEPRRWDDKGNDLWRVFNRVQEGLLNGGTRGRASTGRRMRTRAVTGMDEGTKLNKALWTLADRLAAIKQGVAA